jgi:hypothetical protein
LNETLNGEVSLPLVGVARWLFSCLLSFVFVFFAFFFLAQNANCEFNRHFVNRGATHSHFNCTVLEWQTKNWMTQLSTLASVSNLMPHLGVEEFQSTGASIIDLFFLIFVASLVDHTYFLSPISPRPRWPTLCRRETTRRSWRFSLPSTPFTSPLQAVPAARPSDKVSAQRHRSDH